MPATQPITTFSSIFLQRLDALVAVLSFLESDVLLNQVIIGVGGGIASISSVLYEKGNENLFEKYYKKYKVDLLEFKGEFVRVDAWSNAEYLIDKGVTTREDLCGIVQGRTGKNQRSQQYL